MPAEPEQYERQGCNHDPRPHDAAAVPSVTGAPDQWGGDDPDHADQPEQAGDHAAIINNDPQKS
jgi:hypothetical protein